MPVIIAIAMPNFIIIFFARSSGSSGAMSPLILSISFVGFLRDANPPTDTIIMIAPSSIHNIAGASNVIILLSGLRHGLESQLASCWANSLVFYSI